MTRASCRLHPRDRAGLAAYYFLYYCAVGFIGPFLPLYWHARGLSYGEIGMLLALASAPGALALVFIGALSDRWRTRRPFIAVGSSLAAVCYVAYPHVDSFAGYAVLQALAGIGTTTSVVVTAALGADVFPERLEGRSFASVRAWGTIGYIAVMALAFLHPGAVSGARFFYAAAAFHLSAVAGALIVRRERPKHAPRVHPLHGAGHLLASRNVLAFVAAFFLTQLALMSASANLSLYLTAFRPEPAPQIVPLAYGVSASIELPFLIGMGWAADRFGRMLPLAVAFITLPLRLAGYFFAPAPGYAIALQGLHGLTFSVLAVVPFAFMTDVTPREHNATGQAVLNAAGTAALAIGPLLAGEVASLAGIRTLFLWLAAAAALGSVIFFTMVREPARRPVASAI